MERSSEKEKQIDPRRKSILASISREDVEISDMAMKLFDEGKTSLEVHDYYDRQYAQIIVNHTADFVSLARQDGLLDKPTSDKFLEIGGQDGSMIDLRSARGRATAVTIDVPIGLTGTGTWSPHNEKSMNEILLHGNIKSPHPYSAARYAEESGSFDYVPLIGDGREMPYFAYEEFGTVFMHDVVSDPSISDEDIASLIKEALRVGERLVISNDNTAEVARVRFDKGNFESAGIKVEWIDYGDQNDNLYNNSATLTKTPRWSVGREELVFAEPEVRKSPEKRQGTIRSLARYASGYFRQTK